MEKTQIRVRSPVSSVIAVGPINLFLPGLFCRSLEGPQSARKTSVKEILFVDAVSGMPLKHKEKVYPPRVAKRGKRSGIVAMFVALIAFIVLLATWALS